MKPEQAYSKWAEQYDTNDNKTRDLESYALRAELSVLSFENCLEIGCGTGKNTVWLAQQAKCVTAVDLTEAMLVKAKEKVPAEKVTFIQADVTKPWLFINNNFDLVCFSLVLEHIEDINDIFAKAGTVLKKGGYLYIGELHPFKQYTGSKARFETEKGVQIVECHLHHITDFIEAAKLAGLQIMNIQEYFDDNDRSTVPRILTMVFTKP